MRRFLIDFLIGVVALPLATWAAVWFSFQILNIGALGGALWAPLGILIFIGPFLWLPIYYGGTLIWVLRPVFWGRFGRAAAAGLCLAGWVGYAEYQSIQADIEAAKIAETNKQIRPIAGIDAVTFADTKVCDADCTELLAGGFVKTVYLENRAAETQVLTLTRDRPCEGASALASKLLRDNNRFDLCINVALAPGSSGDGLLFQKSLQYDGDFHGHRRSIWVFTVSQRIKDQWQPVFQRKYGDIYVIQYFPIFISGFTDIGWIGTDWWRRDVRVGRPLQMRDVIDEALGVRLLGSFDAMKRAGPFIVVPPPPAPPAALAADVARMSIDSDPAVRRQAAGSINRFVKENKTYEPVRRSLERLLADPNPLVKQSAYQAIIYPPIVIDDQLLKLIMSNPDWNASALGTLVARLGEDRIRPYQAQIIAAYFDTDRVNNRGRAYQGRETLAIAVTGLPIDGLKTIFDRCPEIAEAALNDMGATIDSDQQHMSNVTLLKLKATWAPCALQRLAALGPYAMLKTARGLAWVGDGSAAAAEIEKRLTAPKSTDTDIDKSNLQGLLRWLRGSEGDFQKRWANSAALQR